MNWNDFLAVLTWCMATLALCGALALTLAATDCERRNLNRIIAGAILCGIVAVLSVSIIGGMGWYG